MNEPINNISEMPGNHDTGGTSNPEVLFMPDQLLRGVKLYVVRRRFLCMTGLLHLS
jgi:hypothetical protein